MTEQELREKIFQLEYENLKLKEYIKKIVSASDCYFSAKSDFIVELNNLRNYITYSMEKKDEISGI